MRAQRVVVVCALSMSAGCIGTSNDDVDAQQQPPRSPPLDGWQAPRFSAPPLPTTPPGY